MELPGGIYHVVARGNDRKAIFRDNRDREIDLEFRDRLRFRVLAYCLMSNHLHLALERGPVESTFSRGVKRLDEAMGRDQAITSKVSEMASAPRIASTGIHD